MSAAVAASWAGSFAVFPGFFFPPPAARPVQVPIANTAGDWLIAVVTWRQTAAGEGVTVSVADDAHNWWEPLGAPGGDSSAAGVTRCAIWAAPAARVANTVTGVTNVQVAASGSCLSLAVRILDVSGMLPWMTMTAVVTNFALAATSLSLSAAAPSAQALMLAIAGSDNNADTIGGPGAGWTALTPVTATNGVDHTADITLSGGYQVTTGATAAAWTSSGALDFSGVIAGVLVSGAAPSQPNPNWPVVITEIAPGSGAQTPPSQLAWTPLSARALSLSVQQGRQYTLAQLMAGQGTITIDNPDGALIPPGTGAFAGIDSGTPIRQRVIVPAAPSPNYTAFSGYLQRWPWASPGNMLRGETQATLTDAWGYAAGLLNSMAREECLLDGPYALWPLDDPAGSQQGSNIAPGNSLPLRLTLSKYGAGGSTVAFGANSGGLIGDSSAKITASGASGGGQGMFSQTLAGTSLNTNGYGYALTCADGSYPPISGGVTIECFFADLTYTLSGPGFWNFIASTSGSLFTTGGAFATGQPVTLSGGSLPGGFSAGVVYYVIGATGTTFQLSAAPGGSAITVTSNGSGTMLVTTPWSPVVFCAFSAAVPVVQVDVSNITGALLMRYTPAGTQALTTVTVDAGRDYRFAGLNFLSMAFNRTSWRIMVNSSTFTGTFSSPLPTAFAELDFGGVQNRAVQGFAFTGYVALAAVYPVFLAPVRSLSHFYAATPAIVGEAACDRVERLLEYAGLTGRRWLGQQVIAGEGDLTVSGQDIGGQGAATSAGNIAASTVPAMLYVAPTGDITYLSKFYTWNQPVRWILGDNIAAPSPVPRAGAFLSDSAYGASDWTGAYAAWQALGGPPITVSRAYYTLSSFGVPLRTDVAEMIAAGIKVCIDLQPAYNPTSGTDLANMTTFLQALKTAGAVCDISLWHEPFFSGLTAAQYTAMIAFYGPTVRSFYPLAVCVSGTTDTDPVNGYYPPAGTYDKITVDAYAGSATTQITLAATQADAVGVPFGIWELNSSTDPVNGQTQAQAAAFFAYVTSFMLGRAAAGKQNADLILFSSGNGNSLGTGLTAQAGFEGGTGTWGQLANCTIASTTAQAHSGTHSLAITATGTSAMGAKSTSAAGFASGMAVTPGQTVSASASFLAATVSRSCQVGVIFYTSGGAVVSTTFGSGVADGASAWTQASETGLTVPATAAWAIATTQILSPGGAGEVHYLDDVSLAIDAAPPNLTTPLQFSWDYRFALWRSALAALLAPATEIPFTIADFSTDYDPARVVNDIQITQLDTQTVTVPSGVMASTTVAAIEAASEAQYGDQPYQVTGYLTADATSPYSAGGSEVDLANWIADVFAKPKNRVQAVTVNAAANAANASSSLAWQFWAGASNGDMVKVNVRMPTAATSPLISLVARITQTQRAGQFSQDGTSATITCVLDFAPEYNCLTCDDPVRGLLNGTNVLGW